MILDLFIKFAYPIATRLFNFFLLIALLLKKANGASLTSKDEVIILIKSLKPHKTNIELIRLGPKKDGGYLVPNDLMGIAACFSPGVGNSYGFEEACKEKGMKIFLADASVNPQNIKIADANFTKKFVGVKDSNNYINVNKWLSSSQIDDTNDLILQMDIEGDEYRVIETLDDTYLKKFRIIVIEFHYLHKLWLPDFYNFAQKVFNKILNQFYCVHIHPNNCCGIFTYQNLSIPKVLEITFIRKDRVSINGFLSEFPHPLDIDNTLNSHIALPKIWYSDS